MELIKKKYAFNEFYIRDNKSDDWVIKEVINPATYQKALEINNNDIVLDLGLNIGAFCVFWGYKASDCYAYEPELENYKFPSEIIKKATENYLDEATAIFYGFPFVFDKTYGKVQTALEAMVY